jgi:cbb3-type cytochrome oxidase maturation protein
MDILYLLIPLSIVLVFIIGALFWWSLRHGQFEDLEGPGYRLLMDDDRPSSRQAPDAGNESPDSPLPPARPGSDNSRA